MSKRRWIPILAILLIVTSLAACGAMRPEATPVQGIELAKEAPAPAGDTGYRGNDGESIPALTTQEDRKVIRTASLRITVKDTAQVLDSIQTLADQLGGYIVSSRSWREDEQVRAEITLRIPATQLHTALQQIKAQATEVDNESISGQDVTEEYTNLEARLRNLEATEKELQELLTTVREKTGKAEDILAVYRELTQIREQIETLQGRIHYLDTMTAMATINVDIWPEPLEKPVVEPGWKPLTTLRDAFRTLVQTAEVIVDGLIWLVVYVVPALAVLAAPIVLVWWLIKRARRKKKPSSSS